MTVPRNVGPPPTSPASPRKPQEERTGSDEWKILVPVQLLQGTVLRIRGLAQDVPQQEDEDPRRQRVEEALRRPRQAAQARHRQAQEDRRAGDRSQQHRGALAHTLLTI